ncbi:hypothetical protein SAMN02745120_1689 [Acetoanaerobium noterae]|uniref:Lipoprotein n=1 Tax=Acetoanaerobium noterae TaxID=745369 RepID=A0A1T5BLA9_9FIRM|nr:hypothetical protein [Acetoanaerobium noterae]SKB47750.1 hypothetical protein SAMN02745120_1689 [Acetoanaerobium noterae]
MKKKSILIPVLLVATVIFAGCTSQLDVVADKSISSFESVINELPIEADSEDSSWILTAPDNSAKFLWSKDFSSTTDYDVKLEFDSQPFINAGLDISKLPEGAIYGDKIILGTDLSDEKSTYNGEATPLDSYKKIVEKSRDSIGYHVALDHYGIDLENGNMFEWAKDISTNDKDIVFVLNPQMFIDAGVNPQEVEGWVFAKVETMDKDGKKIEVDKFLKPFDLK